MRAPAELVRDQTEPTVARSERPIASRLERKVALGIGLLDSSRAALLAVDFCDFVDVPSVEAALEALKTQRFQAIFLEALLPELSPRHLDQLRSAAPELPRAVIGPPESASKLGALSEAGEFRFLSVSLPAPLLAAEVKLVLFPRTTDRVSFAHARQLVQATINGRAIERPLLDLSNRGVSFGVEPGQPLDGLVVGAAVTGLRICSADGTVSLGPVQGTIRRCSLTHSAQGSIVKVGVSIESAPQARSPHARVASDPLAIAAALRKAASAREPFVITLPDSDEGDQYERAEVLFEPEPTVRLHGTAPAGVRVHDVVRLSASRHGQSYTGLAAVLDVSNGVRLALPRTLRIHHRRQSNRHQPTPSRPYHVRLHCGLTGRTDQFPVYDINAAGLSVVIDRNRDLMPPSLRLDTIDIVLPDGSSIEATGVVRAVSALPRHAGQSDTRPFRCGIELLELSADARLRLAQSLLADGFAHAELAAEGDFDAIWQFFADSGFTFHLYRDNTPESIETARNGLGALFQQARSVGFSIVYRDEGAIRGHISGIKVYARTYLTTHLAALQSGAATNERISRALILGITEQLENRPDLEFVKMMWKRDQRWSNNMGGWVGRALQRELAVFSDVPMLARLNDTPLPIPHNALPIEEARPGDFEAIERYFWEAATLSRLNSEDLTARSLALGQIGAEYAACGLHRRRRIRTVRVDGQLAAFSLLERSTPGVQLAEVLNSFDVHTMPEVDPFTSFRAKASLIADAAAFYAAEGLKYSVALVHSADTAPFVTAGFQPKAAVRTLTLHRSALRSWADFSDLVFQRSSELMKW